jgi:prepilin-type N-terminal cleavage/methylation domain-containing protein
MKRLGRRGVTLLELLAVMGVSGILMGIAGFTAQGLLERDEVEIQITQMHRDMLNARVRAFERNMVYFVTVTNNDYQITEDTNESGGTMPDPGDRALWSVPKQFKFPSKWNGTIIMEAKGLISKSTSSLIANDCIDIRFNVDGMKPEKDCISVEPTRIREGRWNGINCVG